MKDLTLIIPAKNEPESLPFVLIELQKLDLNYLIVMEKNDFVTINSIEKFKSKIIFIQIVFMEIRMGLLCRVILL